MGLFNVVFGRTREGKLKRENYFSVINAGTALNSQEDIRLTDKAGIVFNPVTSTFLDSLASELADLLEIESKIASTTLEIKDDDFGTRWIALCDRNFENLARTLHLIGERITDHGFGDRLLAVVFGLEYQGKNAYWIYNIKRGRFYPLVLSPGQQRDNVSELRLSVLMEEQKLHVEKSLENWYALGGIPF